MSKLKDKNQEQELENEQEIEEEEISFFQKIKNKIESSKESKKKKDKEIEKERRKLNFFYQFVIYMIIFTFVIYGGSLIGFKTLIKDITKAKIKNEDGSISIELDAQTLSQNEGPEKYIGKVFGETIRLGDQNQFTSTISNILNDTRYSFNEQMYYIRNVFDSEINNIIKKNLAKKMGYTITKEYLSEQVGKKFYADSDGEVDYNSMKKDIAKINENTASVYEELLINNFNKDFFLGVPMSYDEIWEKYKFSKTRISFDYINILNSDVDINIINQYFDKNKADYKQYKLTRITFDITKKDIAQEALNSIKKEPAKFEEIANKYKEENKIISLNYDSDYSFLNDFESSSLKDAVKTANINSISNDLIEIGVGIIIFKVNDIKQGDLKDENVKNRVKMDYYKKFSKDIEKGNENKAKDIYAFSQKNNFDRAANVFNIKIETTKNPINFMGYIPYLNLDNTDDIKFMISLFKSEKNMVLSPHKHSNGYMIARIKDKEKASKKLFDNLYEQLISQYSDQKAYLVEQDFFTFERKKHIVVDNFNYINWQMLFKNQQENK